MLAGPRQVGKTTLARQLMKAFPSECHYASADALGTGNQQWIVQQWEIARLKLSANKSKTCMLILDEVQKVHGWSDVVKSLWDEDSIKQIALKVIILGSSPLLVQRGLTESLAGRFEVTHIRHWSFTEMRDAFDISLDEYEDEFDELKH